MTIIVGLFITLGCILGGFVAMGGHVGVIWQPWEYVIICGSALGTFIVANPMKTIKDTGKGIIEAFKDTAPTQREVSRHAGRSLRADARAAQQVAQRGRRRISTTRTKSPIFQKFPSVRRNDELTTFICDYCRLIIIGNARTHEIEALMDEEIQTIIHDKMKAYHAMVTISDAFPALGIVAAVLGVIKAMGALDQAPEVLGALIGAALVGTFAGIFLSYAVVSPLATKIKVVREKKLGSTSSSSRRCSPS